jgi:hypothetical protein
MSRLVPLALIALAALSGCSKPAGGGNGQPGTTTASAATPAGTPCDRKLVSQADVAGLFTEPIANMKALPGDPQSCTFTTTGFSSATVSLRPGLGKVSIDLIKSGKTNQTVTPLPGVGERAVWDATLKEVDAEKNGALCTVDAIGPASGGATPEKVGAICNKVLAGS